MREGQAEATRAQGGVEQARVYIELSPAGGWVEAAPRALPLPSLGVLR